MSVVLEQVIGLDFIHIFAKWLIRTSCVCAGHRGSDNEQNTVPVP